MPDKIEINAPLTVGFVGPKGDTGDPTDLDDGALYVSPSGDDGNAGNLGAPKATLAAALAAAPADGLVIALPGAYDESDIWPTNDRVRLHLTAGARIEWAGDFDDGVINSDGATNTFHISGEGAGSRIEDNGTGARSAAVSMLGNAALTLDNLWLGGTSRGIRQTAGDVTFRAGVIESSDGCVDVLGPGITRLRAVDGRSTNDGFVLELDHASAIIDASDCHFETGDHHATGGTNGLLRLRGGRVKTSANEPILGYFDLDMVGTVVEAGSGSTTDVFLDGSEGSGNIRHVGCLGGSADGSLRVTVTNGGTETTPGG